MHETNIVQKIWNLCHILRGDGISYHEYISELTYLLFLKIAEETGTENLLPENCRWKNLINYKGNDLLTEYRDMLTYLGGHSNNEIVKKIYTFPTTVFSHSENLKAVLDGIAKIDWHSINADNMGDIYEGLLSKNSQDARSGAGQYFTPRALVDSMVALINPKCGEIIQDPAAGTGGFLISANHHILTNEGHQKYNDNPPFYEGVEIEKSTYRICLMNTFLHKMDANIILGDALTEDIKSLGTPNVILANPPFGVKSGSARKFRNDISYGSTNKQLAFLQHIYQGLNDEGRAAVVLPDNVLFEEGVGSKIRQDLMEKCDLHTILRLPVGIFYSPGVKTNVLFFQRKAKDKDNSCKIWYYDMRTNSEKFGRKRPLLPKDFQEFESFYLAEPRVENSRWKCFSREDISRNLYNLDIFWLAEAATAEEYFEEPDDLLAIAYDNLNQALLTIQEITELMSSDNE